MKKSKPGLKTAMEFEFLVAGPAVAPGATTPRLYAVHGVSGVYRRVKRSGRGIDEATDGHVLAQFEGSVIELEPAENIMEELAEALFPIGDDDTAHVASLLDVRDKKHESEKLPCDPKTETASPPGMPTAPPATSKR